MNHSIYSADRTTHLKIVVAALVAAVAVTSFALSAHLNANASVIAVVKAGNPVAMSSAAITITR